MAQTSLSKEEIWRRAEERYAQLRDQLEADERNIGKIIVIDVESGDYEVDDYGISASDRLQERHPNGDRYGIRIGYDAVYSFAGPLPRSKS